MSMYEPVATTVVAGKSIATRFRPSESRVDVVKRPR
jgi:hypothetical protein